MSRDRSTIFNFRLPPQGLMMQLVTIILLPLMMILLAITFGSITIHQRAMRAMIGERDERTINTAAKALSAQIDLRAKELASLSLLLTTADPNSALAILSKAPFLMMDFDQGLGIFDSQGVLITYQGDSQLWQAEYTELLPQARRIKVIRSSITNEYIGLIPAVSENNQAIIGAFSISLLVKNTLEDIMPSGDLISILLVDQEGQLLYRAGDTQDYSGQHPGIAEALQGRSGSVYVKVAGDEHVTAYSPVTATGWALITEESWEAVSTPTLRSTQVAPLVLVPALIIMFLALWLGARQVVQPLRTLESKAARLAGGDFISIQEPVGGIAEIQTLQKELVDMAQKVQDAQRSLHGYIGSITAAQEDERQRLARELHDDTLQALIALKQRVQLAQLELQSAPEGDSAGVTKLDEISSLTEKTIENLRRLTRDLRPIYLEDLGLVPALEMLTHEASQVMGIPVEFHRQGVEKRLEPNIELALYRMAQEALSNISRHARAKRASVLITFSAGEVKLIVEDDGIGFNIPRNAADYAINGHYGLLGLHERAELIGAKLVIRTAQDKGTKLTVTFPE